MNLSTSSSKFDKNTFESFRLACILVAKNPSVETVQCLKAKLRDFRIGNGRQEKLLNPLLDYIALPLLVNLKSNRSESLVEESLLCLTELLETVECTLLQSFISIFSACILVISSKESPAKVKEGAEEVKLAALRSVCALIRCSSLPVLLQLFSSPLCKQQLGHAIFLLLKIAQHETNRDLRILALDTVCSLGLEDRLLDLTTNINNTSSTPSYCASNDDKMLETAEQQRQYKQLHEQLSSRVRCMFSSFLPGISTTSCRVTTYEANQGHRIVVSGLCSLGYFVTLVLDNDFIASHVPASSVTSAGSRSASNTDDCATASSTLQRLQQQLGVGCSTKDTANKTQEIAKTDSSNTSSSDNATDNSSLTADWLSDTSSKMVLLIEGLCRELVSHPHPAVRRQLAHLMAQLVMRCNRSLPGCIVPCVEALAALAADGDSAVSQTASTALKTCQRGRPSEDVLYGLSSESSRCHKDELPEDAAEGQDGLPGDVQCALQERLCQAIRRLPTVARGGEPRRVLSLLRKVQGCLSILGPARCSQLLLLPGLLPELLHSLAAALEYDRGDPDLLMVRVVLADPLSSNPPPSSLGSRRQYLHEEAQVTACRQLCSSLASSCRAGPHLLHTWTLLLRDTGRLAAELLDLLPALLHGYVAEDSCEKPRTKEEADLCQTSLSEDEIEQFVCSVLDLILTDTMMFATTDINCPNKSGNSVSQEESTDNSSVVTSSSHGRKVNVANSLEHIYSEYNSPFNPCVASSNKIVSTTLNVDSNTEETSSSDEVCPMSWGENTGSVHWCKQQVLVVAASLRAVAACARLMGRPFVMFLSRVMCALLERCGDTNVLLAHTARQSLDSVGRSCGYGDLHGLVEHAVPHFWFPLSLQLKRPQEYPRAPQILQVALQCGTSNSRIADFLQQLLQELLQCLDSHRSLSPHQLLALLRLYMANKQRQLETATQTSDTSKQDDVQQGGTEVRNEEQSYEEKQPPQGGRLAFREQNEPCGPKYSDKKLDGTQEILHDDVMTVGNDVDMNSETCAMFEEKQKQGVGINEKTSDRAPSLGPLALFLLEYHRNHLKVQEAFEKNEEIVQKEMDKELLKCDDGENIGVKGFKEHVLAEQAKEASGGEHYSDVGADGAAATDCDDSCKHDEDSAGASKNSTTPSNDSSNKEIIPEDVQLIVSILERCCFLLHTRDRAVVLILLDTIELGCKALRAWENSQLPVLHKVWKPLVLRIKGSDTVVTLRALTVLCVMVTCSGDFLRKRCLKELLPAVQSFLVTQSSVSRGKTPRTGYLMTDSYYTQRTLLQTLYPALVSGLQLDSGSMVSAVHCLACYLDERQPSELVQASLAALQTVAATHPQHVWLALVALTGDTAGAAHRPSAGGSNGVNVSNGVKSGRNKDRSHLPPAVYQLLQELS